MTMDSFYLLVYWVVWPFFHLFHPMRVTGRENIPQGPAVVCPNHSTISDPVFAAYAFQTNHILRVMAKEEVMHWPVIGWLLKKAGVFGVKRGSADIGAVKIALRYLKEGRKLLLFPEGTRVGEGEEIEAKTGAAMLAVRTGVPIIPVYIQKKKRWFSTNVVVIGEPYYPQTEGRKGTSAEYRAIADDLMDRIRSLGEGME